MQIHQEELQEINRFIKNQTPYGVKGKARHYERYIRLLSLGRKIDANTRMLEVGTGMGWFPILCKANGLQCKGLEISPQLIEAALALGADMGIKPDIELGNVEDTDIGVEQYDAIVASSVFEHVEKWYSGLKRVHRALTPGGVLFFESTNKFSLRPTEYPLPFYGWMPNAMRYRFRRMVQGPDVMKLGIDFHQFRYSQLRRALYEIGFRKVLDAVDIAEPKRSSGIKGTLVAKAKHNRLLKGTLLTFMDATTLVCIK